MYNLYAESNLLINRLKALIFIMTAVMRLNIFIKSNLFIKSIFMFNKVICIQELYLI